VQLEHIKLYKAARHDEITTDSIILKNETNQHTEINA
jgi:hypothetical protein